MKTSYWDENEWPEKRRQALAEGIDPDVLAPHFRGSRIAHLLLFNPQPTTLELTLLDDRGRSSKLKISSEDIIEISFVENWLF